MFQKVSNFAIFSIHKVSMKKNETTSLLPLSLDIDFSQKTGIIWSKGNVFSFDLRYTTLLYVRYDPRYDYKTETF